MRLRNTPLLFVDVFKKKKETSVNEVRAESELMF